MQEREASDDGLMHAISKGDHVAFQLLMRRHRRWVCGLLYAFSRDRDQAEDLTQEVFARVHQHAGSYQGQGQFVAWLKRIATNLAKNALRDRRNGEKHTTMPLAELELAELEEASPQDRRWNPMEALLSKTLRQEVRAAIQSLPDEQRLALIMRFFGDMSVQDIAWAMKCPEGTIKSRLFHGLRRVREKVTATDEYEGDQKP